MVPGGFKVPGQPGCTQSGRTPSWLQALRKIPLDSLVSGTELWQKKKKKKGKKTTTTTLCVFRNFQRCVFQKFLEFPTTDDQDSNCLCISLHAGEHINNQHIIIGSLMGGNKTLWHTISVMEIILQFERLSQIFLQGYPELSLSNFICTKWTKLYPNLRMDVMSPCISC